MKKLLYIILLLPLFATAQKGDASRLRTSGDSIVVDVALRVRDIFKVPIIPWTSAYANGNGYLWANPQVSSNSLVYRSNSANYVLKDSASNAAAFISKIFTTGSIPFGVSGSGLGQDNSNFFWDATNKYLNIGMANGTSPLSIASTPATVALFLRKIAGGAANVGSAVGQFQMGVYNTTNNAILIGAQIRGVGTEAWASGAQGAGIAFSVTPNGSTTLTEAMRIDNNGRVGIGITSPTAWLNLPAGSATLVPLKLTAGTLKTAAESGAIEFDGNRFYQTHGTTREQVAWTGDLAGYAPLASPTFTGTPLAPTPASNVNTTQIVTGAWVNTYYAAKSSANTFIGQQDFGTSNNTTSINGNTLAFYGADFSILRPSISYNNVATGAVMSIRPPTSYTTGRSIEWPDASGTVALTSAIPISGTGSFIGDGITTGFVINHSLGATPTRMGITATNSAAAAALMLGWYISAKTSTTFTVTFLTAPIAGTGNITYTAFP